MLVFIWGLVQEAHISDELGSLRDALAESERSVRVMKAREARALERCADMERNSGELQEKMSETEVNSFTVA